MEVKEFKQQRWPARAEKFSLENSHKRAYFGIIPACSNSILLTNNASK